MMAGSGEQISPLLPPKSTDSPDPTQKGPPISRSFLPNQAVRRAAFWADGVCVSQPPVCSSFTAGLESTPMDLHLQFHHY